VLKILFTMTTTPKYIDSFKQLIDKRFELERHYISQQTKPKLSRKIFLEEIKEQYSKNKLVLVLGAGVSASCGVPSWDRLLEKLLADTFVENKNISSYYSIAFEYIFKPNHLKTGRYISNFYNKDEFEHRLKDLLYPNDSLKSSNLICEIADLCILRNRINSVITYNYDDILEENIKLKTDDSLFDSIFKRTDILNENRLPIFHVHGFLPRNEEINIETDIVLSENSYHEQYQDIYSWQNIIQIDKFCNNSCLFIGISLTDPNMRRLLDIAKRQLKKETTHYIIKVKNNYSDIKKKLEIFTNDKKNDSMARLMTLLDVGSTKALINKIQEVEEQDALSFNIQTLWVNNVEEIPDILKLINKKTE